MHQALTFDDGPHGTLTPRLLAALKQKNVVVTFFVMGIKVEMHPEIVAAALQDGHEIGNHVREAYFKITFLLLLNCVYVGNVIMYVLVGVRPSRSLKVELSGRSRPTQPHQQCHI